MPVVLKNPRWSVAVQTTLPPESMTGLPSNKLRSLDLDFRLRQPNRTMATESFFPEQHMQAATILFHSKARLSFFEYAPLFNSNVLRQYVLFESLLELSLHHRILISC
jgi:hypothetical protein